MSLPRSPRIPRTRTARRGLVGAGRGERSFLPASSSSSVASERRGRRPRLLSAYPAPSGARVTTLQARRRTSGPATPDTARLPGVSIRRDVAIFSLAATRGLVPVDESSSSRCAPTSVTDVHLDLRAHPAAGTAGPLGAQFFPSRISRHCELGRDPSTCNTSMRAATGEFERGPPRSSCAAFRASPAHDLDACSRRSRVDRWYREHVTPIWRGAGHGTDASLLRGWPPFHYWACGAMRSLWYRRCGAARQTAGWQRFSGRLDRPETVSDQADCSTLPPLRCLPCRRTGARPSAGHAGKMRYRSRAPCGREGDPRKATLTMRSTWRTMRLPRPK